MDYELTFIINPLMEKSETDTVVGKIRASIAELNGQIKKEKDWEKRKLAYPIKKQLYGYYYTINLIMEADKIDDLQKKLKINNDILRYLAINKTSVKQEEETARKPRKTKPATTEKAKSEKTTDIKEEKVKIEDLDKKLEEILKE